MEQEKRGYQFEKGAMGVGGRGLLEGPTERKGKGESDPILIVIENVFLKWG